MSRAFRVMQQMSLVGSLDPGCKARSHDFAIFLLMKRNLLINMIMKITVLGNPSEQVMWSRPVDAASRRNTHYIRCLTVLATLRHWLGIVKIPNHGIEYNYSLPDTPAYFHSAAYSRLCGLSRMVLQP